MTREQRVRVALAVLVAFAGSIVVAAPRAAAAYRCLTTEGSDVPCCTSEGISGMGVGEQRILENDQYIPTHQSLCPTGVGAIQFDATTEAAAIEAFQNRRIDYISTNEPMRLHEWTIAATSRNDPGVKATQFLTLPTGIQGFVVTVNLTRCAPPAGGVRLTPISLAAIYAGQATTWGDSSITADNPALEGCTERIAVSVRDGDGWSNAVLKDYLSKRNPLFVLYRQRDLLASWPPLLPVSCRGFSDSGMAACAATPGGISYMPYKTALTAGVPFAKLENGKHEYIDPASSPTATSPTNCQAAVPKQANTANSAQIRSDQNFLPPALADWSSFSMTYGTGYALCGFHYVIVWNDPVGAGMSSAAGDNLADHIWLMYQPDMQAVLTSYGYAPLPSDALDAMTRAVAAMTRR